MIKFIFALLLILFSNNIFANNENSNHFSLNRNHNLLFLELDLKIGDYIYWKNSGQGGKNTYISLDKGENIKSYNIIWPFPEVSQHEETTTYYYQNHVTIPISLDIINLEKPFQAKINLEYAICNKNECRPISQDIDFVFTADKKDDYFYGNSFKVTDVEFKDDIIYFFIKLNKSISDIAPKFLVEPKNDIIFDNIEVIPFTQEELLLAVKPNQDYKKILGEKITIYSDLNSASEELILKDTSQKISYDKFFIFGLALLAGFLLNFMPCVLPVLSIKLLSIVNNKNKAFNAVATVSGILFSFATLSILSMIAKSFEQEFILGMNFQQPYFIITLIIILSILTCNMLGTINFNLPSGLINYLNKLEVQGNFLKNFFYGVLSTILSTPCTTPFLAGVMLAALTANNFINLALFLTVGIGFSIPYFVVAIFPSSLNILPKSGDWMATFKKILSLPLIATIAWLVSIIYSQMGLKASVTIGCLVLLLKFTLENNDYIFKRWLIKLCALLAIIASFFILPEIALEEKITSDSKIAHHWQKFNRQELEAFIEKGDLVFVDISADWCLSCKYNKVLLLNRESFLNIAKKYNVRLIRADYTRGDEEIQGYLKSYNHFGIPFNVIYGPNASDGIVLDTILNLEDVEKAIMAAK